MLRQIDRSSFLVASEAMLVFKSIRKVFRDRKEVADWLSKGKPVPPPHTIKSSIVKEYAKRFSLSVFVETGTYAGDMVYAVRKTFEKIYSIELDETLCKKAVRRFDKAPHVEIVQGDSAAVLPDLLTRINSPCLFWLDGHYSGGITAKGALETPVLQELTYIFDHHVKTHVVLIDDARCFVGNADYPTLEMLKDFTARNRPDWEFSVKDDIIRLSPGTVG